MSDTSSPRHPVPRFRRALQANHNARRKLSKNTRVRYRKGEFPPMIDWLFDHPDLFLALYQDAVQKTVSDTDTMLVCS